MQVLYLLLYGVLFFIFGGLALGLTFFPPVVRLDRLHNNLA